MFYSLEAERKMKKLIMNVKLDFVYIIQMHNKILLSIVDANKEMKVPVVHRIPDFQYMCPNALFYNNHSGICDESLNGNRMACVTRKCVLNSGVFSGILMMAKWLHDIMNVHRALFESITASMNR